MAEKRMFTKKITDSDDFISLPSSAQALYFHLNQGADDDGFNNQIQNAIFKSHSDTNDLETLATKQFIIKFESGVIVIRHWRLHNTLRKDRYKPTDFQEEFKNLVSNENGIYTLSNGGYQMVARRLPNGCRSIDKNRLDKISNTYAHQDARVSENDSKNNALKDSDLKNEFEKLWESYPNKKSKNKAMKSYVKARKRTKNPVTYEQVEKGIEAYTQYIQEKGRDMQYVKHGSTWFNNECWNDDYTVEPNKQSSLNKNNGWY